LLGNRSLPQTTCTGCAGSSGDFLAPSPPSEKATSSPESSPAPAILASQLTLLPYLLRWEMYLQEHGDHGVVKPRFGCAEPADGGEFTSLNI
jgi:hypothetical protein